MLVYISAIILIVIIGMYFKDPYQSLIWIVLSKSIIDATWNFTIGPFSFIAIEGLIIPVLFYAYFYKSKVDKQWNTLATILFISYNLGIVFGLINKPINAAEALMKSVNILLGFFLIPLLIDTNEKFRKFLIALMIGGLFPIGMSLFQIQTGIVVEERRTVGLLRYVGLYHDAFPIRFFGMFTFLSALMYMYFFSIKKVWVKLILFSLMGLSLLSIYYVFSKAAFGILAIWGVIFVLFNRSKILAFSTVATIGLIGFLLFGGELANTAEQLFTKEISYQSGELADDRYVLAGRGFIWESYFNQWKSSGFISLIMGDGLARPTHNELLRVLLMSGLVGVLLYISFILLVAGRILSFKGHFKPFMLMLFAMYLIDCTGLTPGDYYYYNILVWGIIGLFLQSPNSTLNLHRKPLFD